LNNRKWRDNIINLTDRKIYDGREEKLTEYPFSPGSTIRYDERLGFKVVKEYPWNYPTSRVDVPGQCRMELIL